MNEKEVENKNSLITEDEAIKLAMNANSLTSGLDYLEGMVLNMESENQHKIEQLAGLIAGMEELSDKNANFLNNLVMKF